MRAAKVQASLRIRAVSPEPSLLAHISSESRGTFRQKARSLAPLNGWACAVEICHDGMLEDTNSLDGAKLLTLEKRRFNLSTIPDQVNLLLKCFSLNALYRRRLYLSTNDMAQDYNSNWCNCFMTFLRILTFTLLYRSSHNIIPNNQHPEIFLESDSH